MEEYLKTTIEKLKTNYYADLNLVMGNESCDLDSAVCAVVYATFLNWEYEKIKCCKVCTRFKRDEVAYKDDIYVPILNVDRVDYPLKTEVAYCLREAGIGDENLIFRDDFNLQELVNNSKVKVTLVDHHVLATKDQFLAPYVTEIIDHRPLDKSQWNYKEDARTTIEIVGSCSTLVTQRIRDLSILVAKEDDFLKEYRACADMLHSTITLDTVNFSKEVNKATPQDEASVDFLENILKPDNAKSERVAKLSRLVMSRSDVSSLTASQLLRKDVKVLGDVMIPSFPIMVKAFLTRGGAVQAVSEALKARGCSLALLLGMDLEGGLRRDAAVWGEDPARVINFCESLVSWQPSLDLIADKLDIKSDDKLERFQYFNQRNLGASRKQYIAAVTNFLNK